MWQISKLYFLKHVVAHYVSYIIHNMYDICMFYIDCKYLTMVYITTQTYMTAASSVSSISLLTMLNLDMCIIGPLPDPPRAWCAAVATAAAFASSFFFAAHKHPSVLQLQPSQPKMNLPSLGKVSWHRFCSVSNQSGNSSLHSWAHWAGCKLLGEWKHCSSHSTTSPLVWRGVSRFTFLGSL